MSNPKTDPTNLSKSAVLDLIETTLHRSGVSTKLRSVLLNRIEEGLEVHKGDSVDQEFAYELLYAFKHLLQHGLEHLGTRPGRKFEPVDIETFVCSSEYMGQREFVRPAILSELKRLFEPDRHKYHEVALGGSIGSGKNYFADMALAYLVYDISSYHSPQLEFGLAPGSSIVLMMQSASIKLAKSVLFGQFKARIALSPYFNKEFPFNKRVRTELRFPGDLVILPISSTDTAALGMNIWGGCFPATQTYLTTTGTNEIGNTGIVKNCLTLDGCTLCRTSNNVNVLPTGLKTLVRLFFDTGGTIVCTPDQKFKESNNEWTKAKDAERKKFKFINLPKNNCTLKIGHSQIREILCTGVEHLNLRKPVYDIERVENTHSFLVPTTKGVKGVLVAHNCIDEMSFLSVISGSKKAGRVGIYDQAETLYNTVKRRMESRFMVLGKIPGKLFLIGSANYPGNFIDRKIKETELSIMRKENVTTFVMNMSQWESLPASRFGGETFRIEMPSEDTHGKILEKDEKANLGAEVKNVPVEYKDSFEKDFDGSLRDIAGVSVGSISKFIRDVEKINLAASKHTEIYDGKQLFISDTVDQRQIHTSEDMVDMDYLVDNLDPHSRMGGHIDIALSGDSLGLAIGRVFGFTKSKAKDPLSEVAETLPIFCIDGAVSVTPTPNREIDLFAIRDLILFLRKHLNLAFVTLDSYESAMMMQSFRNNRISSTVQSVDRTTQPYKDLKTAILTGRVMYPNNTILLQEIKDLIHDPVKDKIDHPSGGVNNKGSKDIADCVASVIYRFSHLRASYRAGGKRAGTNRPLSLMHRPSGSNRPKDAGTRRVRTNSTGRLI